MINRIPESELAEMEAKKDIYPHVSVIDYLTRLRDAYAEIDRLQAVQAAAPKLLLVLNTIMEEADAISYHTPLPKDFWDDARTAIAEATGRAA